MSRYLMAAAAALFFAGQALAQNTLPPGKPAELKSMKDKASYSIGVNIGNGIKGQQLDLNVELLAQGIRDALAGKAQMKEDEIREVMEAFGSEQAKSAGDKNKKEAATFLAANKQKEGVQTLPSGLQYKVLKAGTGKKPTAKDKVTTHYSGTLLSGEEFDSSVKRKEPATFPVSGVIAGWTEALQLMPVGSKWQLFVPADLAYGAEGRPPVIPPNAMLIFEVELLAIEAPALPKLPQ